MTWPAILFWLLLIVGAFVRGPFMMYLFFSAGAFGGLSLLPPGAIGNVPLTTICAIVLIGKTFAGRERLNVLLALATDVRKLGLLGLFSLYIVITAFLYPRLFAGKVELYALNFASNLSPLGPTSANVTQPIYMLISILMAFVFADQGRNPGFRENFLKAFLFGALILLATGVIDYLVGSIGQEGLLSPFHNATYKLLDSVSVAGQKRVVGFEPEASVFGGICCTYAAFLIFTRNFYQGLVPKWVVPVVIIGLIYMIYASSSSGAYVGLLALFSVVAAQFVLQIMLAKDLSPARLRQILSFAMLTVAAGFSCLFLPASFYARMWLLLDTVLFQKSTSASYIERGSWTHAGVAAFFKTHGVGVGVGSIRTSSWFVNFAASTGVVGLVLFGSFALLMLLPSRQFPNLQSKRFATALKLSLIPTTIIASLSGTTPDPGVHMLLVFGMIYALKQKPRAALPQEAKASISPKTQIHGGNILTT